MSFAKCVGLALVVAAAAVACSGNNGLPTCPPPLAAQPAGLTMTDPSPGATDVPDDLSEIVFEGFGAPNHLSLTGGTQKIALTLEPAPTPTPQDALPQFIATLSTPLLASTKYTASFSVGAMRGTTASGAACISPGYADRVGSFTTK